MKKIIFKSAIFLFIVFNLLLGCFLLLISTQTGLNLSYKTARTFFPSLEIGSLEGKLIGPLEINDFYFKNDDIKINIGHLLLDWSPMELFHDKIKINLIKTDNIDITVLNNNTKLNNKPKSNNINNNNDFSIPNNIIIVDANIKYLVIEDEINNQIFNVDQAKLKYKTLDWQNFRITEQNTEILNTATGNLKITGDYDNYHFKLAAKLQSDIMPAMEIKAQGKGDFKGLEINNSNIETLSGHINLSGKLGWEDKFDWQAETIAKNINPGKFWPDYPGKLNLHASTKGFLDTNNKKAIYLNIKTLNGRLRSYPLFAKGIVDYKNHYLNLQKVSIKAGSANLYLNGKLNQTWNLNWQLNIPDLEKLIADSEGSITSQGNLIGSANSPQLQGNLVAKNINYKDTNIENINIIAKGDINQQHLALSLVQAESKLNFKLFTKLDDHHILTGKLSEFNYQDKRLGEWTLRQSVAFIASQNKLTINQFCIENSSQHKICGDLNWQRDKQLISHLTAKDIPLQILMSFVSPETIIKGQLNVESNINIDKNGQSTGKVLVSISPGSIKTQGLDELIQFNGGDITGLLDKTGFTANAQFKIQERIPLSAKLQLPKFDLFDFNKNKQKIIGNISLQIKNIAPFIDIIPDIHNAKGSLDSNINISGTMAEPNITGIANIQNASIAIPKYGLNIQNINLSVKGDPNSPLRYQGSLSSGPGTLQIDGSTDFQQNPIVTELTVKGSNLLVYNTYEYEVYAAPDLTAKIMGNEVHLQGSLHVPKAKITPRDFSSTVTLSNDVQFTGQDDSQPTKIFSQITISLGDDVKLRVFGLTAEVRGSIQVEDTPSSLTTATGELHVINGKYAAYGQQLLIRKGSLTFAKSPIDNPALNIEAVRHISQLSLVSSDSQDSNTGPAITNSDQVVGLSILGMLQSPQVTLFSEPGGMSQSDILSYLVLGRPINTGNGSDATSIGAALAALNMGTSQFSVLKDQTQHRLGLDELGVSTEDQYDQDKGQVIENTSLLLGKALSPRLFIDYSIGLTEPINTLRIKYKLKPYLTLQTESSAASAGIDLLYSIEKD